MQVIENFISLQEIENIKDFYKNQQFDYDDNSYQVSFLASWILQDILHKKIQNIFGNYTITPWTDVYQRSSLPVAIHNDSKQKIAENFVEISQQPKFSYLMEKFTTDYQTEGQVLLIPLDQGPSLNTVIWKEKYQGKLDQQMMLQNFERLTIDHGLSKLYDLDHTYNSNIKKWCDYLTLDGIYNWKLGSAAVWDRNQLHCATNFLPHCAHKDAICIMFE